MSVIIRLKNLPVTAGASDVRTFFSGLKIPDGAVHIIGGDEGEVFVGFASDEDARLAMNKNGQIIHNAEIRLLLSSKTEQTAVITARKNGIFSSPTTLEDFIPPAPTHPLSSSQNWPPPQVAANPFAARAGYEPSYPPQGPSAGYVANFSTARPEVPQPLPTPVLVSPKKEEPPRQELNYKEAPRDDYAYKEPPRDDYSYKEPPREDYGYKASFQSPPQTNHYGPPAPRVPEPLKPVQNGPPINQPPPPQISPNNYGFRGNNHGPPSNQGPNERIPQSGDSWRDANYSQPKEDFGRNKFNNRAGPNPEFRKPPILPTPPASQYQPPINNGPFNGPPNPTGRPFVNGLPPKGPAGPAAPFPNRNGPPPFQNGPPMNRAPLLAPPTRNMPPQQFQNAPLPVLPVKPVLPMATVAPAGEKFYIELTRLPNELLRPAALEAFVHPTTPLTLSSVKTVFGPGGIHMHTIIRLDSIADYAMMMRRNGEQGIKIQQSDKKTFDLADDAAPIPVAAPVPINKKEDEGVKRKSRWSDKSPLKERTSPPRRAANRSRSPSLIRKRRRSRSPRRREDHTDPTRWCIQVTNVPFRMKDEDLLEWFAEKVRPAKLSRTYYSDGNASDRWVAEFSSESLMRRAFSIRTLCSGRTLKLSYIDNEKVDEILKIEDVYGNEKRQINEEARMLQMLQEKAEQANPPSFFNQPPVSHRGPPPPNNFQGPPNGNNAGPPMRGGFAPRGNGFQQRGGAMGPPPNGRGHQGPGGPPPFYQNNGGPGGQPGGYQNGPDSGFRGGFHGNGGFRGGRGRGGGFRGGPRDDRSQNELMDLIQSLGPQGTVLSCSGFPPDVTLEDVANLFSRYDPDRNSIRIRRGEDGMMTGDCMFACYQVNDARQAAQDLDGHRWHNSVISVRQIS